MFGRREFEVNEFVFEVTQEADGGFVAECLTETILAQGDSWDELRQQVRDAVQAFFFDQTEIVKSYCIRLHLVRDEILAVA